MLLERTSRRDPLRRVVPRRVSAAEERRPVDTQSREREAREEGEHESSVNNHFH